MNRTNTGHKDNRGRSIWQGPRSGHFVMVDGQRVAVPAPPRGLPDNFVRWLHTVYAPLAREAPRRPSSPRPAASALYRRFQGTGLRDVVGATLVDFHAHTRYAGNSNENNENTYTKRRARDPLCASTYSWKNRSGPLPILTVDDLVRDTEHFLRHMDAFDRRATPKARLNLLAKARAKAQALAKAQAPPRKRKRPAGRGGRGGGGSGGSSSESESNTDNERNSDALHEIRAVFPEVGRGFEKAVYDVGPYVIKVSVSDAFGFGDEYDLFLERPYVYARTAKFRYRTRAGSVVELIAQEKLLVPEEGIPKGTRISRCTPHDTATMQLGVDRAGVAKAYDLG